MDCFERICACAAPSHFRSPPALAEGPFGPMRWLGGIVSWRMGSKRLIYGRTLTIPLAPDQACGAE